MLREHLAYGLGQCGGLLAGLVFPVLVGAADDLHGSTSSMSISSTSFLICSRSSCAISASYFLLRQVPAYGVLDQAARPAWIEPESRPGSTALMEDALPGRPASVCFLICSRSSCAISASVIVWDLETVP